MANVLLASSSPRRQHLLALLGVEHSIEPSQFDEYAVKQEDFVTREEYVSAVAAGKILEVALRVGEKYPDPLILGGDLMTFVGDRTFHKPKTYEEARENMRVFMGVWHDELVAVGTWSQGNLELEVVQSQVYTPMLNEEQLDRYLQVASPLDKSGGYSIAAVVKTLGKDAPEKVELRGPLTTVLGLPLETTAKLLRQAGAKVPTKEHEIEATLTRELFPE